MRRALVIAILASVFLAGCAVRGEKQDPFAYTKKPLYTGHFDLADMRDGADSQEFRVEDGSIPSVHVRAWMNMTSGGAARLDVVDSSGRLVWTTSSTGETNAATNLGTWTVNVNALSGATGTIDVVAARR
ncbi:MAG: hypothetical protein WDA16_04360 [Candidatus Thermoplasmatota archaeon]